MPCATATIRWFDCLPAWFGSMREQRYDPAQSGSSGNHDRQRIEQVQDIDCGKLSESGTQPKGQSRDDKSDTQRQFPSQRWINIVLRSAHLVGVAGIGGGFLFGLEESIWAGYWWLTLITGFLLSLLYFWMNPLWLFQLKGLVIIAKVVLLVIGTLVPAWRAALFVLVILFSALIAHAPGKVRGYQIWTPDSMTNNEHEC